MFFQIAFNGIKIVSTLEYFRGFVKKSWTDITKQIDTVVSLAKRTF